MKPVRLSEIPFMSLFRCRVGRPEAENRSDIPLTGQNIQPEHCSFVNEDGVITLVPCEGADCYVNGQPISHSPIRLTTGSRVILGRHHVFRFNDPQEARQSRHNLAAAATSIEEGGGVILWRPKMTPVHP